MQDETATIGRLDRGFMKERTDGYDLYLPNWTADDPQMTWPKWASMRQALVLVTTPWTKSTVRRPNSAVSLSSTASFSPRSGLHTSTVQARQAGRAPIPSRLVPGAGCPAIQARRSWRSRRSRSPTPSSRWTVRIPIPTPRSNIRIRA